MFMIKKISLGWHKVLLSYFFISLLLCMLVFSVNGSIESTEKKEDEKKDTTYNEVHVHTSQQRENEKPLATQQEKPSSSTTGDKKAPHTFVEKIQAALDSRNSKVMHSYLKELMRLRINLDKIKDDLQDVTYDDADEIKGLKEFLEYLDFSINHGMECIQAGLSDDRKNTINAIPGQTEAPRIEFTVQPIDKTVVLQMMESVKNLKTCLRDQKKRCKRLYAEAKEAIVVAQERLTEAVEAYTDLLQHIEGKPYVKQDVKLEDDDKEDDDSRST